MEYKADRSIPEGWHPIAEAPSLTVVDVGGPGYEKLRYRDEVGQWRIISLDGKTSKIAKVQPFRWRHHNGRTIEAGI